jgi:Reverse transcriptase (RNA-dependent DNA polymerase)
MPESKIHLLPKTCHNALSQSHPTSIAPSVAYCKLFTYKWDRIICKVKSWYCWARTHKYGIVLPKSIEEALLINREMGTDLWQKAIEKEMWTIYYAFKFLEDNRAPVGYQKIDCHMVFNIKMTLEWKARYVAGGHQTEPTKDIMFAIVELRDSIQIAFLVVLALNDPEVLSGAYLNAKAAKKVYILASKEFGPEKEGKVVVITHALYGLHSSGRAWRDHMAATLQDGGYSSCKADPDVWMHPRTKPDGFKYWSYILVYMDDILIVDHEPKVAMDYLASRYTLKPGSTKEPDTYLGAQVSKHYISGAENPDKPCWAMSSEK